MPRLQFEALRIAALKALRFFEGLVVDDAKMRRVGAAKRARIVRARQALARRGVFHHPDFVPDDPADIQFVQQNAAAALHVAVDGRGVPARSARRGDATAVEVAGDRPRRRSVRISTENVSDDLRFVVDDREFAGLAFDRAIAIGAATGVPAGADHAVHAAADVGHEILDVHLAHQGAQRAVDAGDDAGGCLNPDAEKIETLARRVVVALVAREPVDILDQQHIETALLRCAHQALEARSVDRGRAADRAILEGRYNGEILARGDIAAQRDLVVDRAVGLHVAGKAGVDGGADHGSGSVTRWACAISAA